MKINLLSRLGGGAFADVWQAKDQFDRDVAVKIVRGSAAVISSALAHAKALARTSHPNVVSMISLERVKDPDSGKSVDGIVMELVEGTTLEERLRGPKLSPSEARVIGAAIASGIAHILRFVSIITVADRKIVHWRDYMDSLAASNALNPRSS